MTYSTPDTLKARLDALDTERLAIMDELKKAKIAAVADPKADHNLQAYGKLLDYLEGIFGYSGGLGEEQDEYEAVGVYLTLLRSEDYPTETWRTMLEERAQEGREQLLAAKGSAQMLLKHLFYKVPRADAMVKAYIEHLCQVHGWEGLARD